MKAAAWIALTACFAVSTLPLGIEDGDPCNACDDRAEESCCPEPAAGHAHGDADDRHETPDSPCHHEQDFHCCCTHTQAISAAGALAGIAPAPGARVAIPRHNAHINPATRETFHVPLA